MAVPPPARVPMIWSRSAPVSLVKAWIICGSSSKVITNASSLLRRRTLKRKLTEASCSNLMRSRMLFEVSSSMPMRNGKSDCLLKYRISCGLPSSKTLKSPCSKSGTNLLRRFRTVKRTSTRLTSRLNVWPLCCGACWLAVGGACWVEDCDEDEACCLAATEGDGCTEDGDCEVAPGAAEGDCRFQ